MSGVAIITSGGDAAGMNPAIKCCVEMCRLHKQEPFLVFGGLEGLIDNQIEKAHRKRVSGILHRGGTILRSSRSPRFFDYDYRKQAFDNLKAHGIDKLIVIGGDGSFRALNQFYADFEIPFSGIPATIDNDIAGTDYCLGVDTAQNVIRECIDSIRDTATSFSRAFVIETMGRDCGHLAMTSALASGAEICLVPEIEYDLESMRSRLKEDLAVGRDYLIAVCAEGVKMADYLTRWISESLGMEARLTVLGHVQRGGSPTVRDRIMAYKFSVAAIESLMAGGKNQIMVFREGTFGTLPINDIAGKKAVMDEALLKLCRPLAG